MFKTKLKRGFLGWICLSSLLTACISLPNTRPENGFTLRWNYPYQPKFFQKMRKQGNIWELKHPVAQATIVFRCEENDREWADRFIQAYPNLNFKAVNCDTPKATQCYQFSGQIGYPIEGMLFIRQLGLCALMGWFFANPESRSQALQDFVGIWEAVGVSSW